jgi:hypothetical protein
MEIPPELWGFYWWLTAFRRQLKRRNKKVKCSYFNSPDSSHCREEKHHPAPQIRPRATASPRKN